MKKKVSLRQHRFEEKRTVDDVATVLVAFSMRQDVTMVGQVNGEEGVVKSQDGHLAVFASNKNQWVVLAKWVDWLGEPALAIRYNKRDVHMCSPSTYGVMINVLDVAGEMKHRAEVAGIRRLIVPGSLNRELNIEQAKLVAYTRGLS